MSEPTDGTNAKVPASDSINHNNINNINSTTRLENMNHPETNATSTLPTPYLLEPQASPQQPSIPLFPFPVGRCGSDIIGPYSFIVNDPSNKVTVRKRINRANTYRRYPCIVQKSIVKKITSSASSSSPSSSFFTNHNPTIENCANPAIGSNTNHDKEGDDNHIDIFTIDNNNNDESNDDNNDQNHDKNNDENNDANNEDDNNNNDEESFEAPNATTTAMTTRSTQRRRTTTQKTLRQYSTRSQTRRPQRTAASATTGLHSMSEKGQECLGADLATMCRTPCTFCDTSETGNLGIGDEREDKTTDVTNSRDEKEEQAAEILTLMQRVHKFSEALPQQQPLGE